MMPMKWRKMKKFMFLIVLVMSGITLVGCNQLSQKPDQSNQAELVEQQSIDKIVESADDGVAANTALEATNQALEDLESIEFGEAPEIDL